MKRNAHLAEGAFHLLLTLVAVALIAPPFARAARLSQDEPSAAV